MAKHIVYRNASVSVPWSTEAGYIIGNNCMADMSHG